LILFFFTFFIQKTYAQEIAHKGFIAITMGPSFPLGKFPLNTYNDENAEFIKTGYSDSFINFGYLINRNFGFCASVFYDQNDIDKTSSEMWWMIVGITAGPMYSIPFKDKFFFDLKAKTGLVGTNMVIDEYAYPETTGSGPGIDLRASLRYNFSKRWGLLTETGYLFSRQKFGDGHKGKIQTVNLGIGVSYNFNFKNF
jgi:hypothetical protein